MKMTLNFSQFCDEWAKWGYRKDQFSYNGKQALFDYLGEYEKSTGEEIELDIVALCCDYCEYDSAKEASDQYGRYYDIEDTPEEIEKSALEWLRDHTTVIEFDNTIGGVVKGGIIIQQF